MADLCLQFVTAREEANGTLIVAKKQIAVIYLKSWFILDLSAAIPINIIIICFVRSTVSLHTSIGFKFMKLLKILQLYRIFTFTKLSKLTQHNKFLEWLISHISIPEIIQDLVTNLSRMLLLIHLTGCCWAIVG
jgi:hypothetical protein